MRSSSPPLPPPFPPTLTGVVHWGGSDESRQKVLTTSGVSQAPPPLCMSVHDSRQTRVVLCCVVLFQRSNAVASADIAIKVSVGTQQRETSRAKAGYENENLP